MPKVNSFLAYSKEKQAKPQQPPTIAQLDKEKGEDKFCISHDPWPAGGMTMHNHDQLQPQPQHNVLQVLEHDHRRLQNNDDLSAPGREQRIQSAVKIFADHVREFEGKNEQVVIGSTHVVDNVLVQHWEKLVREGFGVISTNVFTIKVKPLQDVKMVGQYDNCVTLKDKNRPGIPSTQSNSPSNDSVYGGDFNQVGARVGNGDGNGGSPNDPNGGDSNIMGNSYRGRDDGDNAKKREFFLVKVSNINVDVFIGYNLHTNPYIPSR